MTTPDVVTLESYKEYLAGAVGISAGPNAQQERVLAKAPTARTAAFALALCIGTAGHASPHGIKEGLLTVAPYTSFGYRIGGIARRDIANEARPASKQLSETGETLAFIQQALSLNVSDLAATLKISRPALYAWFKGAVPQASKLERINALRDLADYWSTLSTEGEPSTPRRINPLERSRLMTALTADHIDKQHCRACLDTICASNRSARTYAALFRQHDIPERNIDARRTRIEQETGL